MATDKLSPSVAKLKLLQAVYLDSRLSSTDKNVFATLVTFHNARTGRLDPGYDAIAKRAGLGRSTVIRTIPRLASYLTVTHRPLKRGNDTNTYRLAGVTAMNESTTAVTGQAEQSPDGPASPAEINRIMRGEVVSERDHPSTTAAPPPSATTEANGNDGASVENIHLEAQAQPQQTTSRDVACLQGVEGGNAQAQPQHLESRDGAEKEQAVKADDFAKLRRKIAQATPRYPTVLSVTAA